MSFGVPLAATMIARKRGLDPEIGYDKLCEEFGM